MLSDILISIFPMVIVFVEDTFVNNSLGLYEVWPSLDIPMHLIGGLATAWSAARLYARWNKKRGLSIKPTLAVYGWLIGITAVIGILWEVYEFLLDPYVAIAMQPSVRDTVADLATDLIGASVWCILFFLRR